MKKLIHSSNFKIVSSFLLATLALLALLGFVLQGELRRTLEQETQKQMVANGNTIISELNRQTTLINSLAWSLTSSTEALTYSTKIYRQLLPNLINSNIAEDLVAGGGIWPEPYTLDTKQERASLFWSKNPQGKLTFFDDYNLPEGRGYHHEAWYVPAQHLQPGNCYWSRSYTDPHSLVPMVTCTVVLQKNNAYIGAATIDMKLTGLQEFFREQSAAIGGYVYLVDQNNKFITFPETSYIKHSNGLDNITSAELGRTEAAFQAVAERLKDLSRQTLSERSKHPLQQVTAQDMADRSDQVSAQQSMVMAASLLNPGLKSSRYKSNHHLDSFQLERDLILHEQVNISIFNVPDTYWKLVVVTPTSADFQAISSIISTTSKQLLIPSSLIMLLCFLFIHRSLIRPLTRISNHLKDNTGDPANESLLGDFGQGDLGKLAHHYNEKTKLVKSSLLELQTSNRQLQIHARHDVLTGLYNRRAFEGFLGDCLESYEKNERAIFYVDLDQFKVVNDTAGHSAGDQLLIDISTQIKTALRDEDILARIGGDEFALIVNARTIESALSLANRVKQVIADYQFLWQERIFSVSCSIGVLHLSTLEGDQQKMLSSVDSACYAAKDGGRNRVHLYLPEDDQLLKRSDEMQCLIEVRTAIEEKRLFLEYQLIKSLSETEASGLEALIRIRGRDGKTIYPGKFMPAVEHYNATWQIDEWVIKQSIEEFSKIIDTFEVGFCSINLTADAVNNTNLLSTIKSALQKHHLDGAHFSFEITETSAIANLGAARQTIDEIRRLGCRIALDDFGTGMSSYAYLRDLPIDYLKIDGSFVRNITNSSVDYAFVKSIKDIADAMGIKTVAEWVEDNDTLCCLRSIGITYGQGFGISKPICLEVLINNSDAILELIAPQAPTPQAKDQQYPTHH